MPEIQQMLRKYLQIAGYIRDQILRGDLLPGDAAPPKRGGELMHGPEPRTHRKQPNGPDEFVARGWSKLS